VGFRYTVRSLSRDFSVTGFVKNMPDGRVQLAIEGSSPQVEGFLLAIERQMSRYIRDAVRNDRPATGRFSMFEIRF